MVNGSDVPSKRQLKSGRLTWSCSISGVVQKPRIARWPFLVTCGCQHAKRFLWSSTLLEAAHSVYKEGVGGVSEQSTSCAKQYGSDYLVHTDTDQTKALPRVDATLLVPPASSNPGALLGEIE
jgi:hypothetical protein